MKQINNRIFYNCIKANRNQMISKTTALDQNENILCLA